MPEAVVRMVRDFPSETWDDIEAFTDGVATIVARALSCYDEDEQAIPVIPTEVDMFVFLPKECRICSSKTDILVTVMGIDYPDRIRNIEVRCSEIKDQIKELLPGYTVSVKFISVKPDCWV